MSDTNIHVSYYWSDGLEDVAELSLVQLTMTDQLRPK